MKNIVKALLHKPFIGTPLLWGSKQFGFHKIGKRLAKFSSYMPKIVNFTVPCHSGQLRRIKMYSAEGNDWITRIIWIKGFYEFEKPLPAVYIALLQQDVKYVINGGANTGFYVILGAICASQARIDAFEPYPPAIKWLESNIALNKLDNKVNIFKCAISDETRQANLYVPSKDFGDTLETSSSLNPNERPRHSEILNVPTISLDEHIKQTGDVKVDIIQLDIENYEHVVLEGASDILSTSRPMLIIEVLKTSHFDRLEAICRRFNYKIIQLLPDEILCHASVVYNPKSKNQIFCPTEKINVIKTIAKSLGLPFKY